MSELLEALTKAVIDLTARVKALEAAKPLPSPEKGFLNWLLGQAMESHKVSRNEIIGPRKTRRICAPRDWVCYEAKIAGYSLNQIGEFLGGRDHTTIMEAVKRERHRRLTDVPTGLVFTSRRV